MDPDTVAIYEREASTWRARRGMRPDHAARGFAARCAPGRPRADLGCGPGRFLPALGDPVVALDATRAMLDLAAEAAPRAWRVQADLESLPLRRGALAGAWAVASYVHVAKVRLPVALAQLHHTLVPGAPVRLSLFAGDYEGHALPADDFPGRFFAQWDPDHLAGVIIGAGFTIGHRALTDGHRIEIDAVRSVSLPDTVGPGMRLLVCGLNPSVYAAEAGIGFARPGNRFWPAALAAGLVTRDRDPNAALRDDGVGMTDLVKRATPRAADIDPAEYRRGLERVEHLCTWLRPRAVCFVGLAGWRAAVDPGAIAGWQPRPIGGVPAYVMPSTSGLNARVSVDDLVRHLQEAQRA